MEEDPAEVDRMNNSNRKYVFNSNYLGRVSDDIEIESQIVLSLRHIFSYHLNSCDKSQELE